PPSRRKCSRTISQRIHGLSAHAPRRERTRERTARRPGNGLDVHVLHASAGSGEGCAAMIRPASTTTRRRPHHFLARHRERLPCLHGGDTFTSQLGDDLFMPQQHLLLTRLSGSRRDAMVSALGFALVLLVILMLFTPGS